MEWWDPGGFGVPFLVAAALHIQLHAASRRTARAESRFDEMLRCLAVAPHTIVNGRYSM